MKNLKIGDVVSVSASATMDYDSENNKDLYRQPVEPFVGVIVGQVIKFTGHTQPASGGSFGDDFEPARFFADKSVTLWQVRAGMLNKPVDVHDDDLSPATEPFELPRRALKVPKVIREQL